MEPEPGHEQDASAPIERPLLSWLASAGPFAVLEALPILEALSGLLSSLHAGGVLHDRLGPEHISVMEHADGACILSLPEPSRIAAGGDVAGASEEVDLRELGLLATLLLTGEPPIRDAQGRGPLRPLWYSNPKIPFELGVLIQSLVDDATTARPTARDVYEKVTRLHRELEGAAPEPDAPALPLRRTTTAVFATAELVDQALGNSAKGVAIDPALPFVDEKPASGASDARAPVAPSTGRLETRAELPVAQAPKSATQRPGERSDLGPTKRTTSGAEAAAAKARVEREERPDGEATDPLGTALRPEGLGPGHDLPTMEGAAHAARAEAGGTSVPSEGALAAAPLAQSQRGRVRAAVDAPARERASASGAGTETARTPVIASPLDAPAPVTDTAAPKHSAESRSADALEPGEPARRRTPEAAAPKHSAESKSAGALKSSEAARRTTPEPATPKHSAESKPAGALKSSEAARRTTPDPATPKVPAESKPAGALESSEAARRTTPASVAPKRSEESKSAGALESGEAAHDQAPQAATPKLAPESKSAGALKSNVATRRTTPASAAPKLAPESKSAGALRSSDAARGATPASAAPKLAPESKSAGALKAGEAPGSPATKKSPPALSGEPKSYPAARPATAAPASPAPPPRHGESETVMGPRPQGPPPQHPRQLAVKGLRASGAKLRLAAPPGSAAATLTARSKTPALGLLEPSEAPTVQMELSEEELHQFLAKPPDALARAIAKRASAPKRWKTSQLVAHPGEVALQLSSLVIAGKPAPVASAEPGEEEAPAEPSLPPAVSPWLQGPTVSPAERITAGELLRMVPMWVWISLGVAMLVLLLIWMGTSPMDARGFESDLRGDGPMPLQ